MAQETLAKPVQESGKKLGLWLGLGLGALAAILIAVLLTRDNGKTVLKPVVASRVAVVAAQAVDDAPVPQSLRPEARQGPGREGIRVEDLWRLLSRSRHGEHRG